MKNVLVLLSTYNGEKYLREQIDTLLSQRAVDLTILVRDDGSKDGTINIIEEYERITGKIILIKGENCGSCNSFLKLMIEACRFSETYDYYAFCDQDDVWLEDKLEVAINVLEKNNTVEIPSLYMSAYQMVDESLNKIHTSLKKPIISLPAALAANCATGCTMVFNRNLLESAITDFTSNLIMHDYWVYLVCLIRGGYVFYDSNSHILYRQHGNNVIGGIKVSFIQRWRQRFAKLFRPGDNFKSKVSRCLLKTHAQYIESFDRRFLECLSTPSKITSKLHVLNCKDFWTGSFDCNIKNLGLLITGKI